MRKHTSMMKTLICIHTHKKRSHNMHNGTWPLCLSIESALPWELRMRGIIQTSINPLCVSNLLNTKDKLSSLSQGIPHTMTTREIGNATHATHSVRQLS